MKPGKRDETASGIKRRINGYTFDCTRCSDCCRKDPGAVFLTTDDVDLIIEHLDMSLTQFLLECCRPVYRDGGSVVALLEKVNYDCIFWNEQCIIYEARPLQCRTYPYWPSVVESDAAWKAEAKRCPGINRPDSLSLEEKFAKYTREKNAVYMKMPNEIDDSSQH
jgi:Fe-S-cluster containining protein